MYPEGWLIDPRGKFLIFFSKNSNSTKNEPMGFMDKWTAIEGSPSSLKNRKNMDSAQAISEWIKLTENGWRRVEKQFGDKAAQYEKKKDVSLNIYRNMFSLNKTYLINFKF